MAAKLPKRRQSPNLFDRFVEKVNKMGRDSVFSYEEVRHAFVKRAEEGKTLCPKRLGKRRPISYNDLINLMARDLKI